MALLAAGETECRSWTTKTARKRKYASGYDGFRLHLSEDPSFAPLAESKSDPDHTTAKQYVFVTCAGRSRKTLARYAGILNAAGFSTQIASSCFFPTCVGVWITDPASDAEVSC